MTEAIGAFGRGESWVVPSHPEPEFEAALEPAPLRAAPSPFARTLAAAFDHIDRGEALISRTLRGDLGGLDARTLIAVQAGIYRYAEAVELAAKLVDRAGNSVRTVLSGAGS